MAENIFESERDERSMHQHKMPFDQLIKGGRYGLSNFEREVFLALLIHAHAKVTNNKHSFKFGVIGIKKAIIAGKGDFNVDNSEYSTETIELVSNLNSPYKSMQLQLNKNIANYWNTFGLQFKRFADFFIDSKLVQDEILIKSLRECTNENLLEEPIRMFTNALIAKHVTPEQFKEIAQELLPVEIKMQDGVMVDGKGNPIKSDAKNFAYVNTLSPISTTLDKDQWNYPDSPVANAARQAFTDGVEFVADKFIESKAQSMEK